MRGFKREIQRDNPQDKEPKDYIQRIYHKRYYGSTCITDPHHPARWLLLTRCNLQSPNPFPKNRRGASWRRRPERESIRRISKQRRITRFNCQSPTFGQRPSQLIGKTTAWNRNSTLCWVWKNYRILSKIELVLELGNRLRFSEVVLG